MGPDHGPPRAGTASWSSGTWHDRYLVGELLVWGELGGSHLVRADVERQLVVRADMERTHMVGSDVERRRLVIRWMDRSGRTLQPRRGSMGQHVLGPLT